MHAVASASDDRSVMLWMLPNLAEALEQRDPVTISASTVLTGHQARLWDAQFCGELIITASEDCTCRSGAQAAQYSNACLCHHGRRSPTQLPKFLWRQAEDPLQGRLEDAPLQLRHVTALASTLEGHGEAGDRPGLLQWRHCWTWQGVA